MYTSEADFHIPGIYGGSVRVWANAWDVFRRTPSRGGRGCRAAVDLFRGVFFRDWWDFVFFSLFFFSSNAHGLLQVWGHLLPHSSIYW